MVERWTLTREGADLSALGFEISNWMGRREFNLIEHFNLTLDGERLTLTLKKSAVYHSTMAHLRWRFDLHGHELPGAHRLQLLVLRSELQTKAFKDKCKAMQEWALAHKIDGHTAQMEFEEYVWVEYELECDDERAVEFKLKFC